GRRNDIATGALNRLDIKGRELGLTGLRIPEGVVLGVETALELFEAIQVAVLDLLLVRTPEAVRERYEVRTIGKMTVTPAVPITRGDRARRQRSSVVPAHEGEHEALAGRVSDDLHRVFDRLGAADVEVDTSVDTEPRGVQACDRRCQLDLFRVE